MKIRIFKSLLAGVITLPVILSVNSCTQILEEQPRSTVTPELLQTDEGVELALISVYSHLRYLYGPIDLFHSYQLGTDEATWANLVSAGGNEQQIDDYNITASSPIINVAWGTQTFAYINTCNAIISIGEENGVDPKLLAEARVFRAHDYFLLVQTYGEVPLDLGSGRLAFNTMPYRKSVRDSIEDVYQAIFEDLEQAVDDLAGVTRDSRVTGCITQAFAQHLLAKAYLTYGWWLNNNGKGGSAEYFQKAYDMAMQVIDNSGTGGAAGANGFGLLKYYYDVNLAQNDRNMETLFYVDRDWSLGYYWSEGGDWDSNAPSGKGSTATYSMRMAFDNSFTGAAIATQRANYQGYGRPWRRAMPPLEVVKVIFADKTNDSRYEGTFQTVWYANDNFTTSEGVLGVPFAEGDTVFYIPGYDIPGTTYETNRFAYPLETLPGKNYAIWTPDRTDREHYPSLWKNGPYNPDKGLDDPNATSLRPTPVVKLSETYLIAAEAHIMGATGSRTARDLINVLRERAAYRESNTDAQNQAAAANMSAATPSTIDIDYLLDERMRELYGEQLRWLDLVRTKKLGRAATYTAMNYNASNPESMKQEQFTRANIVNIPDDSKYYLRPIPQHYLDALDMSDAEKSAYQNPGY